MAQVPYTGAPQVQPSNQAIPNVSGEAPADAFGTGIAAATGEFGQAVSKSGDVIFQRAMAMQELANQSLARERDAQYIIEVGKLHAEFNSLQGPAAMQAFPKYQQDINALRLELSKDLNPAAKRMFDASARSTMARTIFNGAGHAAVQNKKWAVETLVAELDLTTKTVEDDPKSDVLFQEKLNQTRVAVANLVALQNLPPDSPQAQKLLLDRQSALWAARITGQARTDPELAAKLLDANKTSLTQQDYLRVDNTVRNQARAIGTANLAEETYDPTKTVDQQVEEIKKKAKALYPDDPIFEKNAVTALRGLWNNKQYISRQERINNQQIVAGAIQSGVKNEQELRADPAVAAAIDALPKTDQLAIPAQINRYNAARDKETNQQAYLRLYGLSNNDVNGFLETDLTKEPLSQSDMRKLFERQQKLKEVPTGDPRVQRAVGWMRGAMGSQLEALGIFKRTKDNIKDYDLFTGALQSALDVWQEQHGKPPTYKDVIETIGPQIIQQRSEPWFFGMFESKKPFFNQEVPQDFTDRIKADVVAKGGTEPTPEQIARAYTRAQYLKLYGKKEKDGTRIPQ